MAEQKDHIVKNRYRIHSELGRGGMGVVFLAEDLQLASRRVVVKVLHSNGKVSETMHRQFQREVQALARIHHPGVVSIVDSGILPSGLPFLVMPFIKGRTLSAALESGPLELGRVVELATQLGDALSSAHAEGVYHLDVKPQNVLLAEVGGGREYAVLIDFGIARLSQSVGNRVQSSMVAGTPAYMAPEQMRGEAVGVAADVYSLAVMMFEMVTGSLPHRSEFGFLALGESESGVNPLDLRKDIPDAAKALMVRGLAFSPDERPGSASGFAAEFAAAVERKGEAKAAAPPTVPAPEQVRDSVRALFEDLRSSSKGGELDMSLSGVDGNTTRRIGESIAIRITAKRSGYLTVFNVGTTGRITMLYPNAWQADNFVAGGTALEIPGAEDKYELTLSGPAGVDRIQAFLSSRPIESNAAGVYARDIRMVARNVRKDAGCSSAVVDVEVL